MIHPTEPFHMFASLEEAFEKLKELGVLPPDRKRSKAAFHYHGIATEGPSPCLVVGYIDATRLIIKFPSGELHTIHPANLREMQSCNHCWRLRFPDRDSD